MTSSDGRKITPPQGGSGTAPPSKSYCIGVDPAAVGDDKTVCHLVSKDDEITYSCVGVELTETWNGYTVTYKAPTVEILIQLMDAVKTYSDRKNENK